MADFANLSAAHYSLAFPPAADMSPPTDRSQPELTAYVLSPHDVVVARSRDWDDRIGWLLARGRVDRALELAVRVEGQLRQHRLLDIVEVRARATKPRRETAA